jgi:hypothetical protein
MIIVPRNRKAFVTYKWNSIVSNCFFQQNWIWQIINEIQGKQVLSLWNVKKFGKCNLYCSKEFPQTDFDSWHLNDPACWNSSNGIYKNMELTVTKSIQLHYYYHENIRTSSKFLPICCIISLVYQKPIVEMIVYFHIDDLDFMFMVYTISCCIVIIVLGMLVWFMFFPVKTYDLSRYCLS